MSSSEETSEIIPGTMLGVVLAGGQSRRMGRDKAALVVEGATLVERAASRLVQTCARTIVAGGRHTAFGSLESVPDGPGGGPVAGILGAAAAHPGQSLLVLACDLPAVPVSLLDELAQTGGDWVTPRWQGRVEPLCAVYRPPALAALEQRALAGEYALHGLADASLEVVYLEASALEQHGDPAAMFVNLNRPEDLRAFLA
jgi:molybdopterin-guanine dinucleotide biosynthesis protein A